MPKNARKRGKGDPEQGASAVMRTQDEATAVRSTAGSTSNYSEMEGDRMSDFDEDAGSASSMDVDTRSAQDVFEDKLKEAIDGILEKSLKGRMNSLKSVSNALKKKVLSDFLIERHVTVTDALERSLKKGKGDEQSEAARALSLLCIQLGLTDEGEAMFATIRPTLQNLVVDPTASPLGKTGCAEALGLCAFISANDLELVSNIMAQLEAIFGKSYLKGDQTAPTHSPSTLDLHCAALESWCLLLTVSSQPMISQHLDKTLKKLAGLLESADLDLRISAGEAIALLYELARNDDEDFMGPDMRGLCEKLKQLSTENKKYQAKKSRKQQRSSFRDILRSIEEGEFKDIEYKFGKEAIYIDTWARKTQYDAFCAQLGSGTNIHLQENLLLRDIFELGAPVVPDPSAKISKRDRQLFNQAMFKARTQVRKKLRDKRMAQLSG